ncbi:helix-turn-helix domain-containing protein [Rhodococcus qingshengii]|uniref:helix-turn-helix domain-containing protein n=2 Tax=Rhodococcus erythropolis group TaxID=2840174 RepID=UPI001C9A7E40|nr:helix-turn-helix domain-containing protein [Rhodococcus erythropolis]
MAQAPRETLRLNEICKNLDSDTRRFWAKVDKSGDCWEWTAARMKTGYGRFGIGSTNVWQAHRFSALLAWGQLSPGALVLHRCDNPACVRPEHLYEGNNFDNNADMVTRNRFNLPLLRGTKNNQAKLTEDQIREMRKRFNGGTSRTQLGREFGVSRQTASGIIAGKGWGWVE